MFKTIVIAVLLAAVSWPAAAQINPFKRSDFELTEKDVALLKAAAAKLYLGETAPLGRVETWANAESGNGGKIELVRIFYHKNLPCRRLQHDITVADAAEPFRFIVDRCKVASGEWKLL